MAIAALAWHPVHEGLFVSGCNDGSIGYWLVHAEKEIAILEGAHDQAVWALEWHPLGHILTSGSNDNNTKFWARNRPGDAPEDIFGLVPGSHGIVGGNNAPASTASMPAGGGAASGANAEALKPSPLTTAVTAAAAVAAAQLDTTDDDQKPPQNVETPRLPGLASSRIRPLTLHIQAWVLMRTSTKS